MMKNSIVNASLNLVRKSESKGKPLFGPDHMNDFI
jgi:hypothetical protein